MTQQAPVRVYLVDDEPSVTRSLQWLLSTVGHEAVAFERGAAFLDEALAYDGPACAVIDLRMPEMTGLEVLEALKASPVPIPAILLTAHGDVGSAVQAMKLGALDFLQKPFEPESFLALLERAARQARALHALAEAERGRQAMLAPLSSRERELLPLLLEGASSKEIARQLGLSPRTVDVHRASILQKTGAVSLRELLARFRESTPAAAP